MSQLTMKTCPDCNGYRRQDINYKLRCKTCNGKGQVTDTSVITHSPTTPSTQTEGDVERDLEFVETYGKWFESSKEMQLSIHANALASELRRLRESAEPVGDAETEEFWETVRFSLVGESNFQHNRNKLPKHHPDGVPREFGTQKEKEIEKAKQMLPRMRSLLVQREKELERVRGMFDMVSHLTKQAEWSEKTFGPGTRTKGILDHIRKELLEIEANPQDLSEWIDVLMLAFDGAWRHGHAAPEVLSALSSKLEKNMRRVWPDWKAADPDKAIEHDRSHDALSPETKGEG